MEPQVFLFAETAVDAEALDKMLEALGGETAIGWLDKQRGRPLNAELLTEVAGRACYKSFGVGLNPNVTKIREDAKAYFQNTLEKGDGSIFEHGQTTWAFIGVSRVFTHELVRHRAGSAFSQESLRYVRPTDFKAWLPNDTDPIIKHMLEKAIANEFATYSEISEKIAWDTMDMQTKKRLTSTLRRMLPDGIATNIIWTTNHRALRHVITMRTSEFAEVEIRFVFDKVAQIAKEKWPLIYQDFEQGPTLPDGTHVWVPRYMKV